MSFDFETAFYIVDKSSRRTSKIRVQGSFRTAANLKGSICTAIFQTGWQRKVQVDEQYAPGDHDV